MNNPIQVSMIHPGLGYLPVNIHASLFFMEIWIFTLPAASVFMIIYTYMLCIIRGGTDE